MATPIKLFKTVSKVKVTNNLVIRTVGYKALSFSVEPIHEKPGLDCVKQSQKFLLTGVSFRNDFKATVLHIPTKNTVDF